MKVTQEEMAHRMGMSLTAYRDLEKGDTAIVNTNLKKVAMLLDTTSEELVLGYRPVQMQGPGLEDVRNEYCSRISVLENRVAELEKIVLLLEETVSAKNEIISILKKSLAEEK
ncbi:MAG: helix-turn-helix transcriptional regulator [Bacteroidales bacterium]|nr:helix-turn-helix transcriptional regulator [Bacteroidales bacterium]